jgi:hypothetical protein
MKTWIFSLIILASLVTTPVVAAERDKDDREDHAIELKIHSVPQPYTFQDYVSDLKESTRIAQTDSNNPVRELEARKNRKSEPLNPIIIRW